LRGKRQGARLGREGDGKEVEEVILAEGKEDPQRQQRRTRRKMGGSLPKRNYAALIMEEIPLLPTLGGGEKNGDMLIVEIFWEKQGVAYQDPLEGVNSQWFLLERESDKQTRFKGTSRRKATLSLKTSARGERRRGGVSGETTSAGKSPRRNRDIRAQNLALPISPGRVPYSQVALSGGFFSPLGDLDSIGKKKSLSCF